MMSPKGPVFATAIIAGTLAAKRTHELVPFCHHVPLDSCKLRVYLKERTAELATINIDCTVRTTHKTGVEMEALVGATHTALTIYDMCKALSHDIVIAQTMLISKQGGKKDYQRGMDERDDGGLGSSVNPTLTSLT
jgi:cyclic pyranopterin phosphate synthase